MSSPSPSADLSRLRINRDAPPPGARRPLGRTIALAVLALLLVIGAVRARRRGGTTSVQVVTVAPAAGSEGGGSGAGTSVTANGYVVARTRASVKVVSIATVALPADNAMIGCTGEGCHANARAA